MRRFVWRAALLGGIACHVAGAAAAHMAAHGVVKERMDAMTVVGDSMRVLTDMVRGKAAFDAVRFEAAARAIEQKGGEPLQAMFPKFSLDPPTEALPAIWNEWGLFADLTDRLAIQAAKLADAAAARPATAPQQEFLDLAAVCNDCHARFRRKK